MFGRSNYCSICGMKVYKEADYQRFGKHFCSQDHANQYVQEMEKSRQLSMASTNTRDEANSGGGCGGCG